MITKIEKAPAWQPYLICWIITILLIARKSYEGVGVYLLFSFVLYYTFYLNWKEKNDNKIIEDLNIKLKE